MCIICENVCNNAREVVCENICENVSTVYMHICKKFKENESQIYDIYENI